MITPIRDIDIFSFKADMISFLEEGMIRCNIISFLEAPSTLNNFIRYGSVAFIPFKIVINVTIKLISRAMKIIDFILAPIQIMIKGPSATLGRLLIIVMKGSNIFFNVGNIYSINAIIKPSKVLKVNDMITSNVVVKIWENKLLSLYKVIKVVIIFDGEEKIKAFMILYFANNSQIVINKIKIAI